MEMQRRKPLDKKIIGLGRSFFGLHDENMLNADQSENYYN